jgi:hypothetical protein
MFAIQLNVSATLSKNKYMSIYIHTPNYNLTYKHMQPVTGLWRTTCIFKVQDCRPKLTDIGLHFSGHPSLKHFTFIFLSPIFNVHFSLDPRKDRVKTNHEFVLEWYSLVIIHRDCSSVDFFYVCSTLINWQNCETAIGFPQSHSELEPEVRIIALCV